MLFSCVDFSLIGQALAEADEVSQESVQVTMPTVDNPVREMNEMELPVNEETKELVRLLTHDKVPDDKRTEVMNAYYEAIAGNPKASLIKCLDRCNNLTTMSWGLSRDRIYRMIKETEEYYPRLIEVIKATTEYNNAAWLLRYQIESMLDIYKRLL